MAIFCGVATAQQPDPVSVGIVLDCSGSIGAKMRPARQVLDQFLKTARPQDEFVLVRSADHPNVETGFTADADQVRSRVSFTKTAGRSALLDAIQTAIAELKQANNTHRIVLVISDGADNASSNTRDDIEELARKSDVRIYSFGVHEAPEVRRRSREESAGPQLLTDLAAGTGGKYFTAGLGPENLGASIGAEIRK
jgi:Ca-activated chloride channel family protein